MDADVKTRKKINSISLLVTCVFLALAIEFSDGGSGFAKRINKITDTLNRAVLDLSSSVNYTDPPSNNAIYNNQTRFQPRGMAGLYNLTKMFIDMVYPSDVLMDGIISIENSQIKLDDNIDFGRIASYYSTLAVIVIALLVLALLFPLCGLCFCLCRCCGNCGARSQPAGKKKDLCAKLVQGTLLIVLATALLFCVVCAFGSNHQLNDGMNSFTSDVRKSVNDTKHYLDSTEKEARHLLVNNYEEFVKVFYDTLNSSSSIVATELEEYTKAVKMSTLANFVSSIPQINNTFFYLKDNANQLKVYASQLNDALRKVKKDLLGTLKDCASINDQCRLIQNNISQLSTKIDYDKLPDMTDQINLLKDLDLGGIQEAANEGKAALDGIKFKINGVLSDQIQEAKSQITTANNTIREALNQVNDVVGDVRTQIENNADTALNHADSYINEYWQYAYYAGLGISCVLLLVTICIALGLVCGICGKRPDGYGDNCCNKGAGGQFLICAVMIMFLSGFFFAVIALVMFLAGTLSDKVVCTTLRDPNPDQNTLLNLIDKELAKNADIDLSLSKVLSNCYNNRSLYDTFNIKSKYDIEKKVSEEFNISQYLQDINFDKVDLSKIVILSEANKAKISKLQNYNLDNNLYKFRGELENNFTNYNLNQIIAALETVIQQLENAGDPKGWVAELQLSVLHINTYNDKLLVPMKEMADNVLKNVDTLEDQLRMGYPNFTNAIQSLLIEIQDAETMLQTNGSAKLKVVAKSFTTLVLGQVQSYIDRVLHKIQNDVGRCGPLSSALNSTLTTTCDKLLLPWNGFWFSIFLTLLLYVLTIIVSVTLASLYQKYKPYGYVETEYLYDAYADRGDSIPLNSEYLYDAYADRGDSIPLNSGRSGGKRGKKKGKKSKRYEDRAPNGEVVAREFTSGSHAPDARYADMAPKHWEEFPNGGPPQYQRAPTEYERPPPYYYPGSGGDH